MKPIRRSIRSGSQKIRIRRIVIITIGSPFLLSLTVVGFTGGSGCGPTSSPS